MTQLDIIIAGIDSIENGLTLKSSYETEKQELEQINSDLSVMAHCGSPRWKINDAKQRITHIKEWIDAEEAHYRQSNPA